ncbi:nitrogenase-stabilizing/protective protein [Ectothiorhodospira magna]|uniref:Nitrogenase-stabilizing/protective protein NifW n=1 Tax=Ectothiorhodospira magna TaxID=867345 RepID=A0A1H8ZWF0_9GAMM|nr:nitrogenase-stabilizing/protective protein NifW [Ectothiorhodospira magna]SEP68088.1 nitrogenase-stabilizing/protective protein [Ectothiorhodospira magna]
MTDATELEEDLREMGSAEEFLEYFNIPYDEAVVRVNRLHILQRFHDYLAGTLDSLPTDLSARRDVYRGLLLRSYSDFVESDARTEKVFKVFKRPAPGVTVVPLEQAFIRR